MQTQLPPPTSPAHRGLALLFPGQGSQQQHMAVELHDHLPEFRDRMDEVFSTWGTEGAAIRRDWLSDSPVVDLDDVRRAQPLLFAIDWAMGRLFPEWGARPVALLGHSVGEVAAAVLAGVFTLDEAVQIMADRIERVAAAPAGGMLAVRATAEELAPLLLGDVVVGAVNGPRQVILAGSTEPLAAVKSRLLDAGYACMRSRAVNPFHSPALAGAAAHTVPVLSAVRLSPPQLPLYSGYTGTLLTPAMATDPSFWAAQLATPVLFWPALNHLLSTHDLLLAEAGPAQALTILARKHRAVVGRRSAVVSLLSARPGRHGDDLRVLRSAVAVLREEGHLTAEPALSGAGPSPPGEARPTDHPASRSARSRLQGLLRR